jgi:hypothetical protein
MATLEELAQAALDRNSLRLRSLTQDFLAENPRLSSYAQPATADQRLLSAAAALIELFAERRQQPAPSWTRDVGPVAEPFYLLASAAQFSRLRELCETESPLPLRRRRLYAPPNFLEFA